MTNVDQMKFQMKFWDVDFMHQLTRGRWTCSRTPTTVRGRGGLAMMQLPNIYSSKVLVGLKPQSGGTCY
ncbi:hypothetical protein QJS04_geneDACA021163 [Acorus gramineus]|uniref:Uncharacterized protein n=1 Tax=Acorus gramineus TaxID=55184 RepID=A0AAV9ADW0_ACOGR|nr:hypothetical protein QJS04_geneDACA021163 [Acorus gramineus]